MTSAESMRTLVSQVVVLSPERIAVLADGETGAVVGYIAAPVGLVFEATTASIGRVSLEGTKTDDANV